MLLYTSPCLQYSVPHGGREINDFQRACNASHKVVSDSLQSHELQECQAPLSMGFSRKEYWSGLPFPFPEDLPHTGIEPRSLAFWADYSLFELQGRPQKAGVSDNAPIGDIDHDNRWAFSNYTSSLPRFSEHPRGVCASHVSRVPLFASLWTRASQAPLSTGFSKHEY